MTAFQLTALIGIPALGFVGFLIVLVKRISRAEMTDEEYLAAVRADMREQQDQT